MISWNLNMWKVKIWLFQEWKEPSKWKKTFSLVSQVLSFRHTNKQAKNVADATFERFCLKFFLRSDLSAIAGLSVTFCLGYGPNLSLAVTNCEIIVKTSVLNCYFSVVAFLEQLHQFSWNKFLGVIWLDSWHNEKSGISLIKWWQLMT